MEAVHLVAGQQIDVLLDEVDAEEVAAYIQVHATPAEARVVGDGEAGEAAADTTLLQQLDHRAAAAEQPCLRRCAYFDAIDAHFDRMPLIG